MTGTAKRQEPAIDNETVENLTTMLDCAIADGARLRLPMFVWLVRLARLELINATEGTLREADTKNAGPGFIARGSGN